MCAKKTNPDYLTEDGLYDVLSAKYSKTSITRQYRIGRKQIDFFIQDINTFVEFEGAHHYQKRSQIDRDLDLQDYIVGSGFRMVHIPYFVQVGFVLPFYFGEFSPEDYVTNDNLLAYRNGFIDKKCVRPIDFSVDGWFRFIYEVSHYPTLIREEIRSTMSDDENEIYNKFWADGQIKDYDCYGQYEDLKWLHGCHFG